MARKRKPLNDPPHTATHEAGHAVIARVLTLACGEAVFVRTTTPAVPAAVTHDPMECESIWLQRCRLHDDGAVYRARIMAFMAGREAETDLLGSSQARTAAQDDAHAGTPASSPDGARCRGAACRTGSGGERIDGLAGRSVADVPDSEPAYLHVTGSEATRELSWDEKH